MANNCRDRAIPRDLSKLRVICRSSIKRLISQIENERASGRSIAKKIGVSHKLVQLIVKKPDRNLSRKVMIKIVQRTTRKQLVESKPLIPPLGCWNKHSI